MKKNVELYRLVVDLATDAIIDEFEKKVEELGPAPEGYTYVITNPSFEHNPYTGNFNVSFEIELATSESVSIDE